ncbi:hypothetical protein [Streptomyces cyaneus]|uniref:hypothetical protein n=1 Tax=Streptomyces cyaneus TaxID=1904 RepID=UPI0013E3EF1E|nr:hypothetical protein [Streptomyces cyaneus]
MGFTSDSVLLPLAIIAPPLIPGADMGPMGSADNVFMTKAYARTSARQPFV